MNDPRPAGPRFPGELSDHLPTPDAPPVSWADLIRHTWVFYTALAVVVPLWVGSMVAAVVLWGDFGIGLAAAIALSPLGLYFRVLLWRHLTNRDVDTGERLPRRDR